MTTYDGRSAASDPDHTNSDLAGEVSGVAPTLKVSGVSVPVGPNGVLGRYRIIRQLGQGGMGTVYLAHDQQLDRSVALKIPRLDASDDAEVLGRFLREARAAATLHHPNICPIFDVGEIDGVHYLTMAYLDGQPLSKLIETHPRLQQRGVADLVRKLALALHEAHARGVVHRDLKPANIMISDRHEPVIMDFGLARRAGAGDPRLTAPGAIMGTPAYMPPEQIAGIDEQIGPSCDIYSLGVILYELLAGRLPFEGSLLQILSQIATTPAPPLSQFRPDLDPALVAICQRAMSKRAADRYALMDQFAEALAGYLGYRHETVRLDGDPTDRLSVEAGRSPAGGDTQSVVGESNSATLKSASALSAEERMGLASQLLADLMARVPAEAGASRGGAARSAQPPWWLWGAAALLVLGSITLAIVALLNKSEPKQQVTVRLDVSTFVYKVDVNYYLDGKQIDREQLAGKMKLAVGEHKLEVKLGNQVLESRPFRVASQDAQQVVVVPPPSGEQKLAADDTTPSQEAQQGTTQSNPAQGSKTKERETNAAGVTAAAQGIVSPAKAVDPRLALWVQKDYASSSNPLHSVLSVNGGQVAKLDSQTQLAVGKAFRPGWNELALETTPSYPAEGANDLKLDLGPAIQGPEGRQTMTPVLWHFRNGDGWKFKDGKFTHQLGPETKQVRLGMSLYYAGLDFENIEIKEGDFVLQGDPYYGSSNPSVTATVIVNGMPLNTFASPGRQVVITKLLKQGANDIRLISKRVENCLEDNDVHLSLMGPAEWNAYSNRFELRPIAWYSAMTGWRRNKRTGQLANTIAADSAAIERRLPLYLRQDPKATSNWDEKPVMSVLASRYYGSTENPLHGELKINGQMIGLFTSNSREMIVQALRKGDWNEVTVRTLRQHPAADGNHLQFQLGPVRRDEEGKLEMSPVLWHFDNGGDWKYKTDKLVHTSGPGVEEVTLSFRLFFAGLDTEQRELAKGDYVLSGAPYYGSTNPSVTATAYVNGTPLNTFGSPARQVVITPLVKPGKNEIRLVTARVKGNLEDNDVKFTLAGPMEYDVSKEAFASPPVKQFDSLTGWTRNKKTRELVNQADPTAETQEQLIQFEIPVP